MQVLVNLYNNSTLYSHYVCTCISKCIQLVQEIASCGPPVLLAFVNLFFVYIAPFGKTFIKHIVESKIIRVLHLKSQKHGNKQNLGYFQNLSFHLLLAVSCLQSNKQISSQESLSTRVECNLHSRQDMVYTHHPRNALSFITRLHDHGLINITLLKVIKPITTGHEFLDLAIQGVTK